MIEQYVKDIVLHENILLSTLGKQKNRPFDTSATRRAFLLGFSLMVDHPHSIIIKTIQALGSKSHLSRFRSLTELFYRTSTDALLSVAGQIQSLPEKSKNLCRCLEQRTIDADCVSPLAPRELAQTAYYLATKRWWIRAHLASHLTE